MNIVFNGHQYEESYDKNKEIVIVWLKDLKRKVKVVAKYLYI